MFTTVFPSLEKIFKTANLQKLQILQFNTQRFSQTTGLLGRSDFQTGIVAELVPGTHWFSSLG